MQQLALPWSAEQQAIIGSDPTARMLIDAGPGTGKTAVACGRIAHLVDVEGLAPQSIWMISFTRTAVHEIRDRIAAYLKDPSDARSIRIATLDSHSWSIRAGFDDAASLTGGYEDNIRTVTEMVRNHDGVFEYLGSVEHLLIDEAQDMVGPRADLALTFIEALPADAGVTVLADEAQGIYGFSEADGAGTDGFPSLPEAIRLYLADGFAEKDLVQVHRTDDPHLLRLLGEGRAAVRPRAGGDDADPLAVVRTIIEQHNHGGATQPFQIREAPPQEADMFLLFRRRGEALQASGYFGRAHRRLRLSGLPAVVHPWIGLLLWDWEPPTMTEPQFAGRWAQRMPLGTSPAGAWATLVRAAGESRERISVRKLASVAARSNPPTELCAPDFGAQGPIVGTIHAAKGREASEVRLYLPHVVAGAEDTDVEEEARVLFVGASRAHHRLLIGQAERSWPRQLDTGRAYTPRTRKDGRKNAAASVEIGRTEDLAADRLTGVRFFTAQAEAEAAQRHLISTAQSVAEVKAVRAGKNLDWAYALQLADGELLGYLGGQFGQDLFKVAKVVDKMVGLGRRKTPGTIYNIQSLGLRTLAVDPDSPVRGQLHTPWSESGFMLAPLVTGYPTVRFWA